MIDVSRSDHSGPVADEPELIGSGQNHGTGHIHSHGHSHSHTPASPASQRVRKLLAFATVPLVIATVVALIWMWPRDNANAAANAPQSLVGATVTGVSIEPCESEALDGTTERWCDQVSVRLERSTKSNDLVTFQMSPELGIRLKNGDSIYVDRVPSVFSESQGEFVYSFYEYQRERPIGVLVTVFVLAVAFVGRRNGLRALLALALSLGVLIKFILPAIVAGQHPLLVSLVGAACVMFLALYLSHGINARTTTAVLGTLASLAITGLIAWVSVAAANFTGLSNDEATYIRATNGNLDIKGLLLAGIIIGALGVLDDVTVTQASAVWELHEANPNRGWLGTFRAAMRIGRDHISSVVNTLVLAYAGATLPLLLLFTQSGTPIGEILNGEPVATEIVRMLGGSIGLIAAVPITTLLAALVVSVDSDSKSEDSRRDEGKDRVKSSKSAIPRGKQAAVRVSAPADTHWKPSKRERDVFKTDE